ncbi:alpha amylase catalytic region [Caldicellulosiruptor kronotskyensis 2002]|uniref:Alpha-amylase n=1 Tax=Caldicellulosiruptor kronotskyensis (strain DSM 18902 / VKM B-2412 / 2002) TaxID=632348 RepID=E4SDI3_CALK2|nr:alpha-amylase family glycosyl hydrolase [Caldicellulosiruptor kronotskyensis]ADQ45176.1 alpha amylase catalytic region [Caldicellulosiruptor kronotskyensis 2002]
MKRILRYILIFAIVFLIGLSSFLAGLSNSQSPVQTKKDGLIFYEVFVRSFYDSNGDGIGDINGLAEKLPYIKSLGVNAIWLMPIFESPSYHGYDVTNYYKVNPDYGTNEDFVNFIKKAHKMGIKVIIDMMINHTSSKHPWFIEASSNKNSKYRNYYIWATPNTNLDEPSELGTRQWYKKGDSYYNAIFWSEMPDLNFDNKAVREEMKKIAKFWLEKGVDGFRLDAAKHIYPLSREKDTLVWWEEYAKFCRSIKKDVYLVAEVWDSLQRIAQYAKIFDSCFNFIIAQNIIEGVIYENTQTLQNNLSSIYNLYKNVNPQFVDAPFLTNHDMNRAYTEIGSNSKMKLAAALLLTLPGNPFIYYGEEIGMKGQKPDEYIREPFKWYETWKKGQTNWEMSLYNSGPDVASVEKQEKDKNSLLNFYRDMISFRKKNLPLLKGDFQLIKTSFDILSFARVYNNQKMVVIFNFTGKELSKTINLPSNINITGKTVKGSGKILSLKNGKLSFSIKPYSFIIIN